MKSKAGMSIIIITYNRALELKQTLKELLEQKCEFPWEILVIDQNSSDKTSDLCKNNSPFLKYIRLEKNLGVAGGRNVGARYAQYEYLFFIDDDASLGKDTTLQMIYNEIQRDTVHSMFAFKIKNLDGGLYNWPYGEKHKKNVTGRFECKFFIGCGHLIRKSFFDKVDGYTDNLFFWGEETELVLKSLISEDFPVLYLGNVEIIHRVHGNGRNTYDSNRFYYQVRNRFYMVNTYYSYLDCVFYKSYYLFAYLIKAVKNGWLSEYIKGLLDSKSMTDSSVNRNRIKLSHKQLKIYKRF